MYYSCEQQDERERHTKRSSCCFTPPNVCNGWSQVVLKTGARSSIHFSCIGGRGKDTWTLFQVLQHGGGTEAQQPGFMLAFHTNVLCHKPITISKALSGLQKGLCPPVPFIGNCFRNDLCYDLFFQGPFNTKLSLQHHCSNCSYKKKGMKMREEVYMQHHLGRNLKRQCLKILIALGRIANG